MGSLGKQQPENRAFSRPGGGVFFSGDELNSAPCVARVRRAQQFLETTGLITLLILPLASIATGAMRFGHSLPFRESHNNFP